MAETWNNLQSNMTNLSISLEDSKEQIKFSNCSVRAVDHVGKVYKFGRIAYHKENALITFGIHPEEDCE